MNREDALRKAVEIAPAGSSEGYVLAFADWLLVEERIYITPLPEGWDDPVEIPTEAIYSAGDIGISRFGTVWVMVGNGVWEVYVPSTGRKTAYTYDMTSARDNRVVVIGKVRPSSDWSTWNLIGNPVSTKHNDLYPVGLLALDRLRDVWVYLGDGRWDCYWKMNGKYIDYGPYSTKVVEGWSAVIIGGIREQA